MQEKDIGALVRYAPGGRVTREKKEKKKKKKILWNNPLEAVTMLDIQYLSFSLFFFLAYLKVVKQYLEYFPWIQLSATISPITRTVLKVGT